MITFLLGMMIGAVLSPYAAVLNWPTEEMRERGQAMQLLFGAVVAALSGTGVVLAESNANISSVVGVAIAAALLPPTVNCGICFSYVMIGPYFVVSSQSRMQITLDCDVTSAMVCHVDGRRYWRGAEADILRDRSRQRAVAVDQRHLYLHHGGGHVQDQEGGRVPTHPPYR